MTAPPPSPPVLDDLVPAPWSPARRAAVVAGVVAAVTCLAVLWWSGAVGPNLAPLEGYGFSAASPTGEVEVQIEVRNRGLVTVRDLELVPPTLTGGTVVASAPIAELAPGDRVQVSFLLADVDCDRLRPPRDERGLTFSGRSGLVHRTATVRVPIGLDEPARWRDPDLQARASWWYAIGAGACDPDAFAP